MRLSIRSVFSLILHFLFLALYLSSPRIQKVIIVIDKIIVSPIKFSPFTHKNLKSFSVLDSSSPIIGILQKKSNSFINQKKIVFYPTIIKCLKSWEITGSYCGKSLKNKKDKKTDFSLIFLIFLRINFLIWPKKEKNANFNLT